MDKEQVLAEASKLFYTLESPRNGLPICRRLSTRAYKELNHFFKSGRLTLDITFIGGFTSAFIFNPRGLREFQDYIKAEASKYSAPFERYNTPEINSFKVSAQKLFDIIQDSLGAIETLEKGVEYSPKTPFGGFVIEDLKNQIEECGMYTYKFDEEKYKDWYTQVKNNIPDAINKTRTRLYDTDFSRLCLDTRYSACAWGAKYKTFSNALSTQSKNLEDFSKAHPHKAVLIAASIYENSKEVIECFLNDYIYSYDFFSRIDILKMASEALEFKYSEGQVKDGDSVTNYAYLKSVLDLCVRGLETIQEKYPSTN